MVITNHICANNMELTICPHCGATMKETWQSLTPGLINILIKCYQCVSNKKDNVFTMNELKLTHSEYGNFQKLRFHALIAKRKVNGQIVPKEWVITHRGGNFLKGEISVPSRVKTFRNRVIDRDENLVTIGDVMRSQPYWQVNFDFDLFKPVAVSLF